MIDLKRRLRCRFVRQRTDGAACGCSNALRALSLEGREHPKGVQMYIGGGALLLIIILVVFFL
jgi:hypothetical protein